MLVRAFYYVGILVVSSIVQGIRRGPKKAMRHDNGFSTVRGSSRDKGHYIRMHCTHSARLEI